MCSTVRESSACAHNGRDESGAYRHLCPTFVMHVVGESRNQLYTGYMFSRLQAVACKRRAGTKVGLMTRSPHASHSLQACKAMNGLLHATAADWWRGGDAGAPEPACWRRPRAARLRIAGGRERAPAGLHLTHDALAGRHGCAGVARAVCCTRADCCTFSCMRTPCLITMIRHGVHVCKNRHAALPQGNPRAINDTFS